MDEDELLTCPKCEKPTLHRKGKCRQCAAIKEIGTLRSKASKPFDPIRWAAVAIVLGALVFWIYSLIAGNR